MKEADQGRRRLMRALTVTLLLLTDLLLIRLDYITGPFLPFTVFYVALLFFAMTRAGSTWAYLIALMSAAGRTYTVSQTLLHEAHASFIAWQFATSFSVLALICFLLDRRRYRSVRAVDPKPAVAGAEAAEEEESRRFALFTGQTDRHISLMILATLGFLAAFVPWIHSSSAPEPYCMSADNGKIVENPRTATPAQADAAMRTKVLLLTIDDGPADFEVDKSILDTLDRHLAKSIWFITCRDFDPVMDAHAAQNVLTLHRLVQDGHIIANHSYNHLELKKLQQDDPLRMRREITQCTTAIRNASGTPPVYFRAPFGSFPPESTEIAAQDGMSIMRWNASFDSLFQFQRNTEKQAVQVPAETMTHFVDALQSGDIILIHDTRRSAENLETFLDLAERKGYSFVLPGHELSSEALVKATPRLGDPNTD
jgi:peptidoglycan/xylan/chitin deacetylase (PgdA/CDA1 family)